MRCWGPRPHTVRSLLRSARAPAKPFAVTFLDVLQFPSLALSISRALLSSCKDSPSGGSPGAPPGTPRGPRTPTGESCLPSHLLLGKSLDVMGEPLACLRPDAIPALLGDITPSRGKALDSVMDNAILSGWLRCRLSCGSGLDIGPLQVREAPCAEGEAPLCCRGADQ